MMTRALVRLARAIYRATPVPALRQLYFRAFCRMVRRRKVRAMVNGATFDLDLSEMIDVALYLGQYEPDVRLALERYCRPGMTVLDIGANIGAHTLAIARLVTRTGAVYAFEPTDFAYRKLARNISLNDMPYVTTVKAALSDRNAERQLVEYRSSWRTSGGRSDQRGVADFMRLDDWWAAQGDRHIDVIKIDIDGNEYGAFAGGVRLLERCRPVIVMEAVGPHFADDARNPFMLLAQLGYRFRDAKTHHAYAGAADLARLLPADDWAMTTSMNVIAVAAAPS